MTVKRLASQNNPDSLQGHHKILKRNVPLIRQLKHVYTLYFVSVPVTGEMGEERGAGLQHLEADLASHLPLSAPLIQPWYLY